MVRIIPKEVWVTERKQAPRSIRVSMEFEVVDFKDEAERIRIAKLVIRHLHVSMRNATDGLNDTIRVVLNAND